MNEKFAIDLVAEEPPKEINGRHVWCDGGKLNNRFLSIGICVSFSVKKLHCIHVKRTVCCSIWIFMYTQVIG